MRLSSLWPQWSCVSAALKSVGWPVDGVAMQSMIDTARATGAVWWSGEVSSPTPNMLR